MANMPKGLIKILMPLMNALTPTCEVVSHHISDSLEHPLPWSDRIRLRLHLMGCELCARYEKQILMLHKLVSENQAEELVPNEQEGLSIKAKERIRQNLK